MIEVAIGLVVLFLVLSVITSALNEAWATWSSARGRILLVAIERMLGKSLAAAFYRQPRIVALTGSNRRLGETLLLRWVRRCLFDRGELDDLRNPPAYLEPATFAANVVDLLVPQEGLDPLSRLVRLGAKAEQLRDEAKRAGVAAPGVVAAVAGPGAATGAVGPLHSLFEGMLRDALAAAPPERDGGVAAMERLHAALGAWFGATMDRATGWYRRRTQRSMFLIASVVAVGLNVDSLRIVRELYRQPALREAMAKLGEELVAKVMEKAAAKTTETSVDMPPEKTRDQASDQPRDKDAAMRVLGQMLKLDLPLGWPERRLRPELSPEVVKDLDTNQTIVEVPMTSALFLPAFDPITKWLGLLLSAIAASLGAPFWFQLLNKLVDLRGNGKVAAVPTDGGDAAAALAGAAPTGAGAPSAGPAPVAAPPTAPSAPVLDDAYWRRAAAAGRPKAASGSHAGFTGAELACALDCARLSKLVYRDLAEAEAIAVQIGWTAAKTLSQGSTQVLIVADAARVVVVYRGTEPRAIEDWITDAKFKLCPGSALGGAVAGHVHLGFRDAFLGIQAQVAAALRTGPFAGKPLVLTGHSLGAALATLHALQVVAANAPTVPGEPLLVTFGSPRVGDARFCTQADQQLPKSRVLRFVNSRDLVTRVPARAFGYDHVGRVAYFDQRGRLQSDGADWFRWLSDLVDATSDFRAAAGRTIDDHDGAWYVRRLEAVLPLLT